MDETRILIKWREDKGALGPSSQEVAEVLQEISTALELGHFCGENCDYQWGCT